MGKTNSFLSFSLWFFFSSFSLSFCVLSYGSRFMMYSKWVGAMRTGGYAWQFPGGCWVEEGDVGPPRMPHLVPHSNYRGPAQEWTSWLFCNGVASSSSSSRPHLHLCRGSGISMHSGWSQVFLRCDVAGRGVTGYTFRMLCCTAPAPSDARACSSASDSNGTECCLDAYVAS